MDVGDAASVDQLMLVTAGVQCLPGSGPPKTPGEGRGWRAGVCAGALKEVFGWGPSGQGP